MTKRKTVILKHPVLGTEELPGGSINLDIDIQAFGQMSSTFAVLAYQLLKNQPLLNAEDEADLVKIRDELVAQELDVDTPIDIEIE